MPGTIQEYAAAVTNVIAINRDAEQGFRGAADAVADPMLKQLFEQISAQRASFANDLQTAVKALGFDPTNPSGVGGVVHGAWMALKGLLTGHSAHAILEETERGEDWSVKTYRDALSTNLPIEIRPLIQQQYERIVESHNRIKALRDAHAKQKTQTPPVGNPPPPPPANPATY